MRRSSAGRVWRSGMPTLRARIMPRLRNGAAGSSACCSGIAFPFPFPRNTRALKRKRGGSCGSFHAREGRKFYRAQMRTAKYERQLSRPMKTASTRSSFFCHCAGGAASGSEGSSFPLQYFPERTGSAARIPSYGQFLQLWFLRPSRIRASRGGRRTPRRRAGWKTAAFLSLRIRSVNCKQILVMLK